MEPDASEVQIQFPDSMEEALLPPPTPGRYPATGNPFLEVSSLTIYASPVKTHDPFHYDFDSDAKTPIASSMDWGRNQPSGMGAGLVNLGNTCFLNAILQCFTHTVPFVESLRSFNHPFPCDGGGDGFCVLCVLRDHVELSLGSSGGTISPYKLVENLSYLSSFFRRYDQEDAHEFLQCLLDKLDTRSMDIKSSSQQEESFVKKIFGGRLKSKLRCCNCGHCSDTFEPLIDLSLEIDDADTLSSALESFTKVEKIEESKFTCDNCKEEVLVEKQFTLEQTPSVAAFHLKRFKNDGSSVEKIDKYVEYPLELDLQPFSTNQENNNVEMKYELYAVVVHTGLSPYSGHYFCFIRSSPQTWHRLDDSRVTSVSEEFVLSQEAYILFYARQGTPWFSTLMETQKQFDATSPKSVLDDVETLGEMKKQSVSTSPKSVLNRGTLLRSPMQFVEISPKSIFKDADICSKRPVEPSDMVANNDGIMDGVEHTHSTVPLNKFTEELDKASENVDLQYQTPPRSPSPDIYSKDRAEDSYSIPRDHLRLKSVATYNKANKDLEDSKRKEAIRLTRTMPSKRAMQFKACMKGSQSEGSINKKKRKPIIDVHRDNSAPAGTCRKLNPSISVL